MTSPNWMTSQPTWDQYLDFWSRGQQSEERRYTDALSETRADRAARLSIANGQLRAQRDQIAVQRGAQEAERWYKEQQVRLAEQELGLDRDRFGLQQELGRGELALKGELGRGQLGLGLLELKSQLRGPADWAAFLDAGAGFPSVQGASGFLQAIAQGQQPGEWGAAFGANPTPASLGSLAAAPTQQQQERVANDMALAQQIAGGVGKVAPGALERLGSDQLDYLKGLTEKGGYSWKSLMGSYDATRPGQGDPFRY